MRYVKSAIGLKSYDWSSVELLKDLLPSSITATEDVLKSIILFATLFSVLGFSVANVSPLFSIINFSNRDF